VKLITYLQATPRQRMGGAIPLLPPYIFVAWTGTKFTNLTFRGPCIVIYYYNKSQRDALFLKFILVKNSACFGQIYCPSSGVSTVYTQQLVFVILVMLTV